MDERLKGLKKAMDQHTFQNVQFKDAHRQQIKQQITLDEDITQIILALLTNEKTGSQITQLLHVKGTKSIVNNEGVVYTILHTEEQLGNLESYWSSDGEKYYLLTAKGKKSLQKKNAFSSRQFFQGVTQFENE
ncbi:PadR family transcriptional regulator [Ureibacillus xyleni]|uniref:PadR family transcriptional regulator n=1 Tax=Ureibacillus xyleni TaxID=614648 RepID=A0A285T313_9BACL|nr:helix-turn-helix transcriptional regulator [Ureibacillus xyleni]SOC15656.1 PadR family transcriptional regulator [Ureibacillus xyleni]